MRRFAETCEAIAATTKKTEKVRLAADYLRSLPLEDAARAALFLTGAALPRWDERVLAVGARMVWDAIAHVAGIEPEALAGIYRKHGDLGATAAEALPTCAVGGLSLKDVAATFEALAVARGPAPKLALLENLLRRASPLEAKYIVKIITGDMRIGFKENLAEEALAAAFGRPVEAVQRANMLTGDIRRTLELAAADRLADARLRLFHPIGCMLAATAETPDEIAERLAAAWVEDKYDGIRAQVHKSGARVKLFSRTLDEIVEFPELVAPLAALPGEFVLDGEVLGWRDARPLPFTEFQKRLGRKQPSLWLREEVPVSFLAFDLLYADGELLLEAPLAERRRHLEALLGGVRDSRLQLAPARSCASAEELERAFDAALERGHEGIMAKNPESSYTPGRRGQAWLKLKRPLATLDVVVTGVEFGHGKRHGLLSDYTFAVREGDRWLNIGKAYSGLTDAEIRELTEYFQRHTVEDLGFRRRVEPTVVLEVAFNNIQRSKRHDSGYALRFPRIVRLRPDKRVEDVDTLERVKEIYDRQHRRGEPSRPAN